MSETNKETPAETKPSVELPTAEKPMVIERLRGREDGGVEFILSLSKEQTYVLVNFAVMALIGQGLAVFQDEPFEEQAKPEAQPEDKPDEVVKVTLGEQLH